MTSDSQFSAACADIAKSLRLLRHSEAEEAFRELVSELSIEELESRNGAIQSLLAGFLKNRKRDLSRFLAQRLGIEVSDVSAILVESEVPLHDDFETEATPADRSTEIASFPNSPELFRNALRSELQELSQHHIFQWGTYYRDIVGRLFEFLIASTDQRRALLVASREISRHSTDIFHKGYQYVITHRATAAEAVSKSFGGLQSFLALPIEAYSTYAFNVRTVEEARRLRSVCSAVICAVLDGYGEVDFGPNTGWFVLSQQGRSWLHTLPFILPKDFEQLLAKLSEGEIKSTLASHALPVLQAIERLLSQQDGQDFCLPRLGQVNWDARHLETSLSLPRDVEKRRYLEIHCYLDPAFAQRADLEESISRGANLIVAPLRPDMREWADAHDILRTILVESQGSPEDLVQRCVDVLNHELAKYLGTTRRAEPITFNLARAFPLQNPFLARYFLVYRTSVRNLLKAFEQDTGVRLWCSVRRSGKTTACFDLGASSGNAVVLNQTMEYTEQYPGANIFSEAFARVLEEGRQLNPTFFRDVVRRCMEDRESEASKLCAGAGCLDTGLHDQAACLRA